ncbi:MAG: hypothetical protein OQK27_02765 [Gammaproteobacteria bacterium]|nr:hypothetical protein [Gammaproteobacteria bacterium]MCW9059115.1 hypothetical protein [Gammaproteobacteria bacterium]
MVATEHRGLLLSIVELGGYPNFTPLYQRAGFQVMMEHNMRKALAAIKKKKPAVIVAEFNYQSDFRDRTSSLESMLATAQHNPGTRIVVFYEKEVAHQFEKLRASHQIDAVFSFPIDEVELEACIRGFR